MTFVTQGPNWKLLEYERINPDAVISRGVPTRSFPCDEEVHALRCELDKLRYQAISDAEKKGRSVYPGPQWGLVRHALSPDRVLELDFQQVVYYDNMKDWLLAQNKELQNKAMEIGQRKCGDPYAFFARVMGATAVVQLLREDITSSERSRIRNGEIIDDAYGPVVTVFRGSDQFEYWLTFYCAGGHPKKDDRKKDGVPEDWHEVVKSQVVKELSIPIEMIPRPKLMALAENTSTHKPELLYKVRVNMTPKQIYELKGGREELEVLGLTVVGLDELMDLIKNNQQKGVINHPRDISPQYRHLMRKIVESKGLDPNTSNNFNPPGEAAFALLLQRLGYDFSGVYGG